MNTMKKTLIKPIGFAAAALLAFAVAGPNATADANPIADYSGETIVLVTQDGKGTVKGKILMADGSPAEKCPVKLLGPPSLKGMNVGGGGKLNMAAGFQFEEVSKTLTDASGNFTMRNVPDGSYRIDAGVVTKTGRAIKSVRLRNGEEKDLGEIKLGKVMTPREARDEKKKEEGNSGGRSR